jgi:hypothetical protein
VLMHTKEADICSLIVVSDELGNTDDGRGQRQNDYGPVRRWLSRLQVAGTLNSLTGNKFNRLTPADEHKLKNCDNLGWVPKD